MSEESGSAETGEGLQAVSTIFLRGGESATEQNTVGFAVPNKEKKGVVSTEPGRDSRTSKVHEAGRGARSLCAFLIDLHEGLVNDLGQKQVSP